MGTNYYLTGRNNCEHCGRSDEPIHIGKCSAGWVFLLHVIPNDGINDLEDWIPKWLDGVIKDEYGYVIRPEVMLNIITIRGSESWRWGDDHLAQQAEWTFHQLNYSMRGPNNLLRCKILPVTRCIGHGGGTWDLIKGEFS